MINIRKLIHSYLKTIHPRVYFLKAPAKTTFPYIVYSFNVSDTGEWYKLITLDIDGWDNKDDTTQLETLMEQVNTLNKKVLSNDSMSMTFFLDRQIPLTDEENDISRHKYIYQARLIERG